jgi:type I restriction enzyme S subunit
VTAFPKYDRYKDSGVEWLGEVPAHWEVEKGLRYFVETEDRSLKGDEELLSVSHLTGVTPRSEKNISMFMAESYEGSKLCEVGDIAINTMWAWMAALGVSKYRGLVSPSYGTYRQRKPERFNPTFLDHLIRTDVYRSHYLINSTGITTSRLRLYPHSFLRLRFPCPPIEEQDRIVAFLDRKTAEIDKLIAKKQRQIELLDEQKAILIHRAVTRGLNPNAKLKPSGITEIGEIPETWKLMRVRHAFRVIDCKHLTVPFTAGGYKLISIGELDGLHVDTSSANQTDKKHFKHLSDGDRQLRAGDLIFSRNASVGKCSIVEDPTDCSMGQDVCLLRPQGVAPEFAVRFLRSSAFQKQIAHLLVGSTFNRVNISELKDLHLPLPPSGEVPEILIEIKDLDAHFSKVRRLTGDEVQSLQTLRSTLITYAVTGSIRCP